MADLPTDPNELVSQFCDSWANGDANTLVAYFSEDATYHNVPMEPLVGRAAIKEFLDGFFAGTRRVVFTTHLQVAGGDVVMNERTDTIVTSDSSMDLPVCGVFEVRDGKIARWSDYFDMGQLAGG